MQRIVLVVPRDELGRFEGLPRLDAIESFRVLQQLRFDRRRFAAVCEVKFRSGHFSAASLVGRAGITKVEKLAHRPDGSLLAYVEGRPSVGWARLAVSSGAHLDPPFELTPEAWRVSVVGTSRQLDRFLGRLRGLHIRHAVRALGPARFEDKSALAVLTARQREILAAAHRLGYYGVPRRAGTAEIAESVRLSKSTTVEHLRKAEKRLLDALLAP